MKKKTIPKIKQKGKQNSADTSDVQTSTKTLIDPSPSGGKTKNNDGGYIWLVS